MDRLILNWSKVTLICLIIFINCNANSQTKQYLRVMRNLDNAKTLDTANMRITYSLEFVDDSTNSDKKWKDLKVLLIGNSMQHFYSYYSRLSDLSETENSKGTKSYRPLSAPSGVCAERYDIYYNFPEGKQTVIENICLDRYVFKEELIVPEWIITSDTVTFLNYLCNKAVCHFRGRIWEVWFTPDIPINAGPWKLRGLPGLILKASDDRQHYIFECTGIENLKLSEPIIMYEWAFSAASNPAWKETREKYRKEQREFYENYVNSLLSMGYDVFITDASGKMIEHVETPNTKFKEMKVSFPTVVNSKDRFRKIPYNPIELE